MTEGRTRELQQCIDALEVEVEDLTGLVRGNEHAIVVLVAYLALRLEDVEKREFLHHLRTFQCWPRRALVKKGKQKALSRFPALVRACSERLKGQPSE